MAEWSDIIIPKPKEPYKPKTKVKQVYNEYGFGGNTGMYSLVEENRDFRKHIENEIVMEAVKTQNVLGNHITDEINRNIENTDNRATEIKQKIDSHHDYVVNTIETKINSVKNTVESNTATLNSNTTILNRIWEKLQGITHWI